jgi:AraC family transcriptional regulator
MNATALRASFATESDDTPHRFSDVAARLVEAACLARDGDCEAAKSQIARAIALLRGEPSSIPANLRPLAGSARAIVRGGLAAWQKRRLTAHIDAHLTGRIRIGELAALLNLSKSHFSRAFRCTFGASPHEYLTRRRIEVAQSLMLTTREPLCAIALRCGLSDQSNFTRVFGRIVGETPHAWRRTRRGEIEDPSPAPTNHRTEPAWVPLLSSRPESDCWVANLRLHNYRARCCFPDRRSQSSTWRVDAMSFSVERLERAV